MFLDEKISKQFFEIQKILLPELSIEVGAYDAEFSQMMTSIVDKPIAFEGNPRVYEKFKNKLNDIDYIHSAVSNKNESLSFYVQDRNEFWADGANSIKERIDTPDIKVETLNVPAISLDKYFTKNNKKTCLWIDCEGANEEVLTGAEELLKNVDSIFIEVELYEQWKDCWQIKDVEEYLKKFDFILLKFDKFWYGQANCIFIKKNLLNSDIVNILQK
jgi:FkbM family methyltransferase